MTGVRAKAQQPPQLFGARADLIRHCCAQASIIAAAAPHRFAASSAAAKEGSVPVRYPAALGLIFIVMRPRHKHTNPFRRGDPRRFTSPFRDRYRLPIHRPTARSSRRASPKSVSRAPSSRRALDIRFPRGARAEDKGKGSRILEISRKRRTECRRIGRGLIGRAGYLTASHEHTWRSIRSLRNAVP